MCLVNQQNLFKHVFQQTRINLNYLFIRDELIASGNANPSKITVAEKVASDIEAVWKTASIPIIAHKSVFNKVQSCVSKAQLVTKASSGKRSKTDQQDDEFNKLFDVQFTIVIFPVL